MEITQSLVKRPRLTRTSVPKVRTGCITCKRRHIKCDETKPSCNNCIKNRGYCEGYVVKKEPSPVRSASRSPPQIGHVADPLVQVQLDPDLLDFTDNGMLCFQEFLQLMRGQWMTVLSTSDFWSSVVPQVARSNDMLRNAAMAVGSLSLWRSECGSIPPRASSAEMVREEKNGHLATALSYYGKSLRLLAAGSSLRDALVLSLLLIHFETLQDNRNAAIEHINHGLALFIIILTNTAEHGSIEDITSASIPRPLIKGLAGIFLNLETQTRVVLRDKFANSAPLPHFSKTLRSQNQTIESFSNLLNNAFIPQSLDLEHVPAVFSDLDHAEQYLSSLYGRQISIVPMILEKFRHSGMMETEDHRAIWSAMVQLLEDTHIVSFCMKSIQIMKSIETAFLPLFNRITLEGPSSPEYFRAMQLRLQYLGIRIFNNMPQYLNVEHMQALTPLCYEFLSLASRILDALRRQIRNPAQYVSLQSPLSFELLAMATICRDPLVREEAISILRDYPCQDGLWNVKAIYALAVRNRYVEQHNAIEHTPEVQWMRLWRREYVFENGGERILFRFLFKNQESGEWELVEESGDLGHDLDNVKWTRRPLTGGGRLFMGSLMPWSKS
ncbi:hypothetical protein B0I35DRAFT_435934 [Stachybotrys elegans]|uniref:Zn(2)-C6 fungal-type domain-containing protein n=1 Tax=Stachybotrys elegans TaxID=80388 RepID=A0A8K0WPA3_9HYPO|nr:hypothetical protein B0I35DRAFT_435934 [Stachybotrys elegans]